MHRDWVKGSGSADGNCWLDSALENRTIASLTPARVPDGPLFRAECEGHSLSIRVREDDKLKVIPDCQPEFDLLKATILTWAKTNLLRYTPHEGDVVIFDNWRVLHARAAIGGRHQRIHDRMWIDSLLPEYRGKYLLGIRPLSASLMDAVQRANNSQSAKRTP